MAKLQVYKFVNPGFVKSTDLPTAAAKTQTLALNRVGSTVSSIGSILEDIGSISILFTKEEQEANIVKRREERRKKDAAAEDEQERSKLDPKKVTGSLANAAKKSVNKSLSIVDKFLGPIGGFLAELGAIFITKEILEWTANPKNFEELKTFIDRAKFVFETLFGWAKGLTKTFLDGLSGLVGENSTFKDRLIGLGKVLAGIIGLKYLLNPLSIITDIIDLIDIFGNQASPKTPDKGVDSSKDKGKDKSNKTATTTVDGKTRPVKVTPKQKFTSIQDTPIGSPERKLASKIQKQHGHSARTHYENTFNNAKERGLSDFQANKRAKASLKQQFDKGRIKSRPQLGSLSARSNRAAAALYGETVEGASKLGQSSIFKKGIDKATQRFFLKIVGMGGVKALKKILNRIPVIGPFITFALNWASGESIAKSAAMAVGAGLGELIGAWAGGAIGALGTPLMIPVGAFVGRMLGSMGGEMLGGWLYDTVTGEGGGEGGFGAVGKSVMGAVKKLFAADWGKIGKSAVDWVLSSLGNIAKGAWNILSAMAEFMGGVSLAKAIGKAFNDLRYAVGKGLDYLKNPATWINAARAFLNVANQLRKLFVMPGPWGFLWQNAIKPFGENIGKLWSNKDKFFNFLTKKGTFQDITGGVKYTPIGSGTNEEPPPPPALPPPPHEHRSRSKGGLVPFLTGYAEGGLVGNYKIAYNKIKSNFPSAKPYHIAGALGNFETEAPGLKPDTYQDGGGPGRGIAQWETPGRWDTAVRMFGSNIINSLPKQLEFMKWELDTGHPDSQGRPNLPYGYATKKTWLDSKNITEATLNFMKSYEAPSIPHTKQRLANARRFLKSAEIDENVKVAGKKPATPKGGIVTEQIPRSNKNNLIQLIPQKIRNLIPFFNKSSTGGDSTVAAVYGSGDPEYMKRQQIKKFMQGMPPGVGFQGRYDQYGREYNTNTGELLKRVSVPQQMLSPNGLSEQYAIDQNMRRSYTPVLIGTAVNIPTPVPINTSASSVVVGSPSILTQRIG